MLLLGLGSTANVSPYTVEQWLRYLKERVENEFPASVKNYLETSPTSILIVQPVTGIGVRRIGLKTLERSAPPMPTRDQKGVCAPKCSGTLFKAWAPGIGAKVPNQITVLSHEADDIFLEQRFKIGQMNGSWLRLNSSLVNTISWIHESNAWNRQDKRADGWVRRGYRARCMHALTYVDTLI